MSELFEIGENKQLWFWQGGYAEIKRVSENEYSMIAVDVSSSSEDVFLGIFDSIESCDKFYN